MMPRKRGKKFQDEPPVSAGKPRSTRPNKPWNAPPNVDAQMKAQLWRRMIDFQTNNHQSKLAFEPSLSSEERKYVHKIASNLKMKTKSFGNKTRNERFVTVSKDKKFFESNISTNHIVLPPSMRSLIDSFLDRFPLSIIDKFDSTQITQQSTSQISNQPNVRRNNPSIKPANRSSYLSNPGYQTMLVGRSKLPVFAEKERILEAFDKHSVIVISGATGCGKSTQIPQFILEHIDSIHANPSTNPLADQVIDGEIICTQPRRISAISLAERVASERGEAVGHTVGYQIRLEKKASKHSRVMFCTVGILLRRLQNDPLLSNVSTLIIDEVHERERNCDFLLNILQDLIQSKRRTNLKIVLMSATVNSELFSKYFFDCPHLFCPGFTYPVQTFHLEDVIELTGYDPSGNSSSNQPNNQLKHLKKREQDRRLQSQLQRLIEHQLFENENLAPDVSLVPHVITLDEENHHQLIDNLTIDASSSQDQAIDVEAARQILLKQSEERNKPVGWVDNYVYVPSYDLNALGHSSDRLAHQSKKEQQSSLMSLLSSVNGQSNDGDSSMSQSVDPSSLNQATKRSSSYANLSPYHTPSQSPPQANSQPSNQSVSQPISHSITHSVKESEDIHKDRYANVTMTHSEETLKIVQQIETDGDLIDYTLVVETLHYICTKFADDQSFHTQAAKKQPKKQSHYEIDVSNGSILVFLPGWEDINRTINELNNHPHFSAKQSSYQILPLHGSIASADQRKIFSKPVPGVRKIILSTNIAETSVTIDDVIFVLDTGMMKEKTYDPYSKMSSLQSTWISKANAQQRSGRAGRSRPGVCFRLYSHSMYESRFDAHPTPELLRTPLEEVCLQIKLLRLPGSISHFLGRCLQPPSVQAVESSISLLKSLGALTDTEELTELGEYLAAMPLDPRLGKMILYGAAFQCLDPILTIAACLSYRDPFLLPLQEDRPLALQMKMELSQDSNCDLITLLNACHNFQMAKQQSVSAGYAFCRRFFLQYSTMSMIDDMKQQLLQILQEVNILDDSETSAPSGSSSKQELFNAHSNDMSMTHAVCVAGLYPNAARVSFEGKKKVVQLNTRDALSKIRIHPSSINSHSKKLQPIILDGDSGERFELMPYVMYHEMVRSSEIYVRGTSIASPFTLAFLMGGKDQPTESEIKQSTNESVQQKSEHKDDEDMSDADSVHSDTNAVIDAILREMQGRDADVDDMDDDVTVDPRENDDDDDIEELDDDDEIARQQAMKQLVQFGTFTSPDEQRDRVQPKLIIDSFIQYECEQNDLTRIQSIHRFLSWLIHKRIIKTKQSMFEQDDASINQSVEQDSDAALSTEILRVFSTLLRTDEDLLNDTGHQSSRQRRFANARAPVSDDDVPDTHRQFVNALPASSATYHFDRDQSVFANQRGRGRGRGGNRGGFVASGNGFMASGSVCRDFKNGACRYGDSCRFSHLATQPQSMQPQSSQPLWRQNTQQRPVQPSYQQSAYQQPTYQQSAYQPSQQQQYMPQQSFQSNQRDNRNPSMNVNPNYQSTNQSINQPVNQPMNHFEPRGGSRGRGRGSRGRGRGRE